MTTQFDSEQKAKLTQIINEGMGVMSEVEALNEGLNDTVKSIAEELQIKPSVLKKSHTYCSQSKLHCRKRRSTTT